MDRRTLIAISICFLIFIGWQKFYIEPRMPKPSATTAQTTGAPTAAAVSTGTAAVPTNAPVTTELKTLPLKTGLGMASIGNGRKFITDWTLDRYKLTLEKDAKQISLKDVAHAMEGEGEIAFDVPEYAYANGVPGTLSSIPNGVLWSYEDANMKLSREFVQNPEQPFVEMKISAEFKTKRPNFAFIGLSNNESEKDPESRDRQLLYYADGSIERIHMGDVKPVMDLPGEMKWIGAQSRYFVLALVPMSGQARALAQQTGEKQGKISLVYPISQNGFSVPFRVYFGPKESDLLKAVDPTLTHTIDFGMFTVVAVPILKLLKWIHGVVSNWGLAIILLTLIIKIATFPLTYKSMASMKKMAKLQPEIEKLRKKYENDKEAQNRELLTFMRTNGYNPVSGCLPMVIQMPVFFALYRVLYSSTDLYHTPFFGWIHDLSSKDPIYITPILLVATMWLQQKLTPSTTTDPMQAKMLQYMPIFFGLLMLNLPAGLTVYMLTNAIASIGQQAYMNRKFKNA